MSSGAGTRLEMGYSILLLFLLSKKLREPPQAPHKEETVSRNTLIHDGSDFQN